MLQSVALRYDPQHDRLLMCIRSGGESGSRAHWMHLTRRVCAQWRQDLQLMIDRSAQTPPTLAPAAQAAVSAAHHQAMVGQAPLRAEPVAEPAPADPQAVALVTRITCGQRRDDGRWVVGFVLHDGANLTLVLDSPTLHGLAAALSQRVQAADWALPALPSEAQTQPKPVTASLH